MSDYEYEPPGEHPLDLRDRELGAADPPPDEVPNDPRHADRRGQGGPSALVIAGILLGRQESRRQRDMQAAAAADDRPAELARI